MDVRVELPVGLDLEQTLLAQRAAQGLFDELDTLDELGLLVPLGRFQRPLEVVEDRKELPDEPLVRVRDEALLVASGALAVVLEVRLDALCEIEVLVALGDGDGERIGRRSLGLRRLDLLRLPASR